MLEIIFFIVLIWVTWKLFVLGVKAAWGIAKIFSAVLLFPLFMVGLVMVGVFYIAVPVLIIAGLVAIVGGIVKA